MKNIQTLFCDIGGVLLTNGWDVHQRQKASEVFKFNNADFEHKH
jgi:putative hydrolase of the HAD superfamily